MLLTTALTKIIIIVSLAIAMSSLVGTSISIRRTTARSSGAAR